MAARAVVISISLPLGLKLWADDHVRQLELGSNSELFQDMLKERVKLMLTISVAKARSKSLGYKSFSAYAEAVVRADVLGGQPHVLRDASSREFYWWERRKASHG